MTAPRSPTSPEDTTRTIDLNLTHVVAAALAAVTTAMLGAMLGVAGTVIGAAGASVITTVGTAVYRSSLERSLRSVRGHSRRVAMLRWGAMILGTLGAFLLAMMLITGLEWASGQTIGGNGTGTTIERVITDQPGPRTPPAPSSPHNPSPPTPQTPTETPPYGTTPDGSIWVEPSPPKTSDNPAPSEVTPTPPLLPPVLPGLRD